jgi:hypothetical protein
MALHVSRRMLPRACGEIIAENVRSSYDRPMAKKRIVIAKRSSAVIAVLSSTLVILRLNATLT